MPTTVPVADIEFVKDFYPRIREDDATIERYRAAIDRLPPITLARGRILVDGFHRWQAHKREGIKDIAVEDLGNLADLEIIKQSIQRNSAHGHQLQTRDKRAMADRLYRQGERDMDELASLLSITANTLAEYLRDARRDEKEALQAKAWDMWLDCWTQTQIAEAIGMSQATVSGWLSDSQSVGKLIEPPESRQHFDIWQFQNADGQSSYFGRIPPQVIENLLWLYTSPGNIVVDPFAGGGTTIDVAKAMGRRVWASDLEPSTPTLPIHRHDMLKGWPASAPPKADLILLDPPYWQQAKGRYTDAPANLANMTLDGFNNAWAAVVQTCVAHMQPTGLLAYIISPTQRDDGSVIDHATDMLDACWQANLTVHRRIIVPYQTQQATGQQVEWARENKRLLKLYRDLVILRHA